MDEAGVKLSLSDVDSYIAYLTGQGKPINTIRTYRRCIRSLAQYLGGTGTIGKGSLSGWRDALLADGYSAGTVKTSICVANGYLEFRGRRDLQMTDYPMPAERELPELTREEYLQMLRAARAAGKLRVYVLIKLFAQTGINVHDLTNVTVEAVTAGAVSSGSGPGARTVRLPDKLRQELLEYCRESGIQTGYVFQTQAGGELSRTAVSDSIRVLCRQAGLDDTKSNPRCLRRLYLATQAEIRRNMEELVWQEYAALIEEEDRAAAWTDEMALT